MSINVYWSYLDKEWMRVKEPQSVAKNLYEKRLHEDNSSMNYHLCPFVLEGLKNTFSLQSPYDYSFSIDGDQITTNLYNQDFFNRHVAVRSIQHKSFSFMQPFIFFTEEKSLLINAPAFPHLENNNITKRCSPFVGSIDIGKYFRNIDFAFFLKDPYKDFVIKEGEVFAYVKFETNKKINFIKFEPTEKISDYRLQMQNSLINRKIMFRPVDYYYNNFTIKNKIMKEIKENIVG